MPRATADRSKTKRFDLETCPPDGFVVLRKLDYGEQLRISELAARGRSESNGQRGEQNTMLLDFRAGDSTSYTFAKAIVDHNLEDENGRRLDFRKLTDVQALEVTVGNEVEQLIRDYNSGPEAEELPFSTPQPTKTSSDSPSEAAKS